MKKIILTFSLASLVLTSEVWACRPIKIDRSVHFGPGSYRITPESMTILKDVAEILKGHPEVKEVVVQGFADQHENPNQAQQLSEKRAQAVVDYLGALKLYVSFRYEGFGSARPISQDDSAKGRESNRRVEFDIPRPPPLSTPASKCIQRGKHPCPPPQAVTEC